jgi:hypothetical protein
MNSIIDALAIPAIKAHYLMKTQKLLHGLSLPRNKNRADCSPVRCVVRFRKD